VNGSELRFTDVVPSVVLVEWESFEGPPVLGLGRLRTHAAGYRVLVGIEGGFYRAARRVGSHVWRIDAAYDGTDVLFEGVPFAESALRAPDAWRDLLDTAVDAFVECL
jgi:hypothetical protein